LIHGCHHLASQPRRARENKQNEGALRATARLPRKDPRPRVAASQAAALDGQTICSMLQNYANPIGAERPWKRRDSLSHGEWVSWGAAPPLDCFTRPPPLRRDHPRGSGVLPFARPVRARAGCGEAPGEYGGGGWLHARPACSARHSSLSFLSRFSSGGSPQFGRDHPPRQAEPPLVQQDVCCGVLHARLER